MIGAGAGVGQTMVTGKAALGFKPGGAILGGLADLANVALQYKQFRYQKDLQKKLWKREDTAVERRKADLMRAGLSPHLAPGRPAETGTPADVKWPNIKMENMARAIQMQLGKSQVLESQSKWMLNRALEDKARAEEGVINYNRGKFEDLGMPTTARGEIFTVIQMIDSAVREQTGKGLMDYITDPELFGKVKDNKWFKRAEAAVKTSKVLGKLNPKNWFKGD